MNIYDTLESYRPDPRGVIVTLGTFDGVHRGHQEVIKGCTAWARETNCPSLVFTFREHPRLVVEGFVPPVISTVDEKLALIESLGVDACLCIAFDSPFASIPANRFVEEILVGKLKMRGWVLGPTCRFGQGGRGDADLAERLSKRLAYEVRHIPPVLVRGRPVNSTSVRKAIQEGNLDFAAAMLGRPVRLGGKVLRGEGRGRRLGVPTANVDCRGRAVPPPGVYAGIGFVKGAKFRAAISVGRPPTFAKAHARNDYIEVHLLDFEQDIYGERLAVDILKWLRDQRAFGSEEELASQIRRDIEHIRREISPDSFERPRL